MFCSSARAEAVLLDHRLDAEAAALHQREFGGHVESVGGEQQQRRAGRLAKVELILLS